MYTPNYDTQDYPFCIDSNKWLKRLDTQLYEPTNLNSIKVLIIKLWGLVQ